MGDKVSNVLPEFLTLSKAVLISWIIASPNTRHVHKTFLNMNLSKYYLCTFIIKLKSVIKFVKEI